MTNAIALVLALSTAAVAESAPRPSPLPASGERGSSRVLRVSGEGRASAAPDLALFTVAAIAVDRSLDRATRDVNARARKLLDALAAAGVDAKDRQTSRLEIQVLRESPKEEAAEPRITGYRVTNAVSVKVRDLAKLGPTLDRALAAGANELEGVQLTRADLAPLRAQALAAAVQAARAKAEVMAKAAGLRLGDLLELSESGRGPGPGPIRPMLAMARGGESVPVAEGQIEVEAGVETVFAVE